MNPPDDLKGYRANRLGYWRDDRAQSDFAGGSLNVTVEGLLPGSCADRAGASPETGSRQSNTAATVRHTVRLSAREGWAVVTTEGPHRPASNSFIHGKGRWDV